MIIVDGGYLSWCYGTDVMMHRAWTTGAREKYSRQAGAVICLDPQVSWREQGFPSYKEARRIRTAEDPSRQKKKDQVVQFVHNHLKPDPSLQIIQEDPLEADDLVTMLIILQSERGVHQKVVGTDKDLLQIPVPFDLIKKDGTVVSVSSYANKVPKKLSSFFSSPKSVLLDLCLRGDSSDSIPPSLPPRSLDQAVSIFKNEEPFQFAYQVLGEQFLRNLILAVLPGPVCYEDLADPAELPRLVDSGDYWRRRFRSEYEQGLIHEILQSRSSEF